VTSGTARSATTTERDAEAQGDTLLVFLSDCHIGGDDDRDIFESPDDLAALFDSIQGHSGPVELVLAGDLFDFLRIEEVPEGQNRASATIARPEYRELFAALRRFAAGQDRTVVYLPGNHDAEAWWNREIHAELERAGLVHEFALSYSASFEPEADRIVYCELGNQFDPTNTFRDYSDPLDTPLGDHIVTDFAWRLPKGWEAEGGTLRDVARVFPLTAIPVALRADVLRARHPDCPLAPAAAGGPVRRARAPEGRRFRRRPGRVGIRPRSPARSVRRVPVRCGPDGQPRHSFLHRPRPPDRRARGDSQPLGGRAAATTGWCPYR
jgi:3',5'-cyclic AMP phosphodiesterase CpdA